jgi:putative DNA methylase
MTDTRLIERWLPIAALGIESLRERTPMTPFPAPNRLHVWWARRPLVASRAAVLASILPADADRGFFMDALGIHGDPVASRRRIDAAKRKGVRFEGEAYSYPRAFSHRPTAKDRAFLADGVANRMTEGSRVVVLDPTAGGGAIPFEAARLGCSAFANDLNPVAVLIQKATIEYPASFGIAVVDEFRSLADEFLKRREVALLPYFPPEDNSNSIPTNYIWARTVRCPYCDGIVPLSPNWRLGPDGTGVRVIPRCEGGPGSAGRMCEFEIVPSAREHAAGTVAGGDGICPFPDCGRIIDSKEMKQQAQSSGLGEQLYAVVFKTRVETRTKTGKRGKDKWVRGYRAPRDEDDIIHLVRARLDTKLPDWEALDIVPNEAFPERTNDDRPIQYGMPLWRDMFSSRQLLAQCTGVEIFRELLAEKERNGLSNLTRAAFVYLALSLDKLRDYNSRMTRWHSKREVMVNTFDRHDFAFKWSYAEMAPLIVGVGYDWAIEQTAKCIKELVELVGGPAGSDDLITRTMTSAEAAPLSITCKSGDALDHVSDASVDVVVMDPPYYDNVMYAELSDFFYVWLKRTAGYVVPELFTRQLTDKENEAVASPAKFEGQKGAKALAGRDYQDRMARIFQECRRVLKPNGIMTLMFTHKATGAWDALTMGLMEAGFSISASWPINTEAEGSLHIKDKSAANSTIFLVCRPRASAIDTDETRYWEDVEPLVAEAVRARVSEFQAGGITARQTPPSAGGASPPQASDPVRGGVRPLRCHPGGRTRSCAPRGETLASGTTHAPENEHGGRSADLLVRPVLGCLPRARVPLRRSAASRSRSRCRFGHPGRRNSC